MLNKNTKNKTEIILHKVTLTDSNEDKFNFLDEHLKDLVSYKTKNARFNYLLELGMNTLISNDVSIRAAYKATGLLAKGNDIDVCDLGGVKLIKEESVKNEVAEISRIDSDLIAHLVAQETGRIISTYMKDLSAQVEKITTNTTSLEREVRYFVDDKKAWHCEKPIRKTRQIIIRNGEEYAFNIN